MDPATPPGALPHSRFVIRAAEVAAHADAAAIRAEAAGQAAALRAGTEAERRRAVADGHAEGLRLGMAQAARLAADAADAVAAFLQAREAELHELAFAIAHRLLANLPPHDVLAELAAAALAEHRSDVQLALRVCPADAAPLREALAAIAPASAASRVSVVPDPAAAAGTCTLVHPAGRTRIGLVEQFRAMLQAVA